jgi:acetyltransferase-like isoleucine patch superfamily enzyme
LNQEADWMSYEQIRNIGLREFGEGVQIDRSVRILNPSSISIGSHSRLDAGVILSAQDGSITIGRHVHIGAYSVVQGGGDVLLEDFVGLSYRCTFISVSDDFLTGYMTNPTVNASLRNVTRRPILLRKHVILGANCTILMGTILGFGVAVGSNCKIGPSVEVPDGAIIVDNPARPIAYRNLSRLKLKESQFHCSCL